MRPPAAAKPWLSVVGFQVVVDKMKCLKLSSRLKYCLKFVLHCSKDWAVSEFVSCLGGGNFTCDVAIVSNTKQNLMGFTERLRKVVYDESDVFGDTRGVL